MHRVQEAVAAAECQPLAPQVHQRRSRYETGLQKLLAAEAEVATMKQELIELQPKLIQTQKEVGAGRNRRCIPGGCSKVQILQPCTALLP